MTKERHWTADDLSELRSLQELNYSPEAIAKRIGRTRQAVWRKARRLEVQEPVLAIPLTPADLERLVKRIRRLMAAYPSESAFERDSGIARGTVHRIAKGQRTVFASTLRVIDEMSAEREKAPREIARRPT